MSKYDKTAKKTEEKVKNKVKYNKTTILKYDFIIFNWCGTWLLEGYYIFIIQSV